MLDFYYRSTNRQSWENFLRNLKAVTKIQNELTSCRAAFEMCNLGDERGFAHLKRFGIHSMDLNHVKSAILSRETKLELAELKLKKKEQGEAFKFYKCLASVQYQLKRNIDTDKTTLAEWVSILDDLKERNKAEMEAINKSKRKR